MQENIFDKVGTTSRLFSNKEILRHSHTPSELPHREKEIETIRFNLVEALRGQIPSNMTLYGVTGAGKTAVISYMCSQLESKGDEIGQVVNTVLVNCRTIDTQYRVMAFLGNSLIKLEERDDIPFTGWPTDRVFRELVRRMEKIGGVHVLVLDEIDHLVKKVGDDLLYNLTNLNRELRNSRCCVIGISNDLKFTDYLDPRVRSRLGQEDVIFSPYNADQLQDILEKRATIALLDNSLEEGVIELCSALAAKEHGDARRALDLLRVSTEKAEQSEDEIVKLHHVRMAQNQIECDQLTPVIKTLPPQQKLVLFSVLINERNGLKNIATGEVYEIYRQACSHYSETALTQRRVTDLLSNLDMLGLVTAKTVSKGRYGRSKQINSCLPSSVNAVKLMTTADNELISVDEGAYRFQSRL